jgi:hypothetical protein
MQVAAALAGLLSMLVSALVGVRLVRLARRTRQIPELLIGLDLLLVGCGWSALVAVGRQATALPDATRVALVIAGATCAIAGTACLAVFNCRIFRPGSAGARVAAAAIGLAYLGIFVAQAFSPGWLAFAREERGPWTAASLVAAFNYAWSFLEARRHAEMLRRRLEFGLADPVAADRVRLWTLLMATGTLASLVFAGFQALGVPIAGTTLGLSLAAGVSLFSVALLWLAFLPPARYVDAVRRRAAAPA